MAYAIYTDLDGTLLNHHSYQYQEAIPAIRLLKQQKFPIIPVTSKTRAEVLPLREELELDGPMIVENGAAVFLPESISTNMAELTARMDGFYVKAFAPGMSFWADVVTGLHESLPNTFTAFSDMAALEIAELTGLPPAEAELAAKREFSDPLHWYGSDYQLTELIRLCHEQDIKVVRGGRFVHLLQGSDKGKAVRWLHQLLRSQSEQPLTSIGLGDGENDLAFLAEVDRAVQVRSDSHGFPDFAHDKLYRTKAIGPAGWAEAVFELLKTQHR
ncbi:MAG: HAD-IIB family hydrolase [Reinekea sp.]|jgi:mannosyl-3-phosphoglycerate phosphatase